MMICWDKPLHSLLKGLCQAMLSQDKSDVMYMCVNGIQFVSFYDFPIGFCNCTDSVVIFSFSLYYNYKSTKNTKNKSEIDFCLFCYWSDIDYLLLQKPVNIVHRT